MIFKLNKGYTPSSLPKLLDYHESKVSAGVAERDPTFATISMRDARRVERNFVRHLQYNNPRVYKNYFVQITTNFNKMDRIDDPAKREVIDCYLSKMGYDQTISVAYRHFDKDHDHWHIIATASDVEGKLVDTRNDFYKSSLITRRIEKTYGLQALSAVGINESVTERKLNEAKYRVYRASIKLLNDEGMVVKVKNEPTSDLYKCIQILERVINDEPISNDTLRKSYQKHSSPEEYNQLKNFLTNAGYFEPSDLEQIRLRALDVKESSFGIEEFVRKFKDSNQGFNAREIKSEKRIYFEKNGTKVNKQKHLGPELQYTELIKYFSDKRKGNKPSLIPAQKEFSPEDIQKYVKTSVQKASAKTTDSESFKQLLEDNYKITIDLKINQAKRAMLSFHHKGTKINSSKIGMNYDLIEKKLENNRKLIESIESFKQHKSSHEYSPVNEPEPIDKSTKTPISELVTTQVKKDVLVPLLNAQLKTEGLAPTIKKIQELNEQDLLNIADFDKNILVLDFNHSYVENTIKDVLAISKTTDDLSETLNEHYQIRCEIEVVGKELKLSATHNAETFKFTCLKEDLGKTINSLSYYTNTAETNTIHEEKEFVKKAIAVTLATSNNEQELVDSIYTTFGIKATIDKEKAEIRLVYRSVEYTVTSKEELLFNEHNHLLIKGDKSLVMNVVSQLDQQALVNALRLEPIKSKELVQHELINLPKNLQLVLNEHPDKEKQVITAVYQTLQKPQTSKSNLEEHFRKDFQQTLYALKVLDHIDFLPAPRETTNTSDSVNLKQKFVEKALINSVSSSNSHEQFVSQLRDTYKINVEINDNLLSPELRLRHEGNEFVARLDINPILRQEKSIRDRIDYLQLTRTKSLNDSVIPKWINYLECDNLTQALNIELTNADKKQAIPQEETTAFITIAFTESLKKVGSTEELKHRLKVDYSIELEVSKPNNKNQELTFTYAKQRLQANYPLKQVIEDPNILHPPLELRPISTNRESILITQDPAWEHGSTKGYKEFDNFRIPEFKEATPIKDAIRQLAENDALQNQVKVQLPRFEPIIQRALEQVNKHDNDTELVSALAEQISIKRTIELFALLRQLDLLGKEKDTNVQQKPETRTEILKAVQTSLTIARSQKELTHLLENEFGLKLKNFELEMTDLRIQSSDGIELVYPLKLASKQLDQNESFYQLLDGKIRTPNVKHNRLSAIQQDIQLLMSLQDLKGKTITPPSKVITDNTLQERSKTATLTVAANQGAISLSPTKFDRQPFMEALEKFYSSPQTLRIINLLPGDPIDETILKSSPIHWTKRTTDSSLITGLLKDQKLEDILKFLKVVERTEHINTSHLITQHSPTSSNPLNDFNEKLFKALATTTNLKEFANQLSQRYLMEVALDTVKKQLLISESLSASHTLTYSLNITEKVESLLDSNYRLHEYLKQLKPEHTSEIISTNRIHRLLDKADPKVIRKISSDFFITEIQVINIKPSARSADRNFNFQFSSKNDATNQEKLGEKPSATEIDQFINDTILSLKENCSNWPELANRLIDHSISIELRMVNKHQVDCSFSVGDHVMNPRMAQGLISNLSQEYGVLNLDEFVTSKPIDGKISQQDREKETANITTSEQVRLSEEKSQTSKLEKGEKEFEWSGLDLKTADQHSSVIDWEMLEKLEKITNLPSVVHQALHQFQASQDPSKVGMPTDSQGFSTELILLKALNQYQLLPSKKLEQNAAKESRPSNTHEFVQDALNQAFSVTRDLNHLKQVLNENYKIDLDLPSSSKPEDKFQVIYREQVFTVKSDFSSLKDNKDLDRQLLLSSKEQGFNEASDHSEVLPYVQMLQKNTYSASTSHFEIIEQSHLTLQASKARTLLKTRTLVKNSSFSRSTFSKALLQLASRQEQVDQIKTFDPDTHQLFTDVFKSALQGKEPDVLEKLYSNPNMGLKVLKLLDHLDFLPPAPREKGGEQQSIKHSYYKELVTCESLSQLQHQMAASNLKFANSLKGLIVSANSSTFLTDQITLVKKQLQINQKINQELNQVFGLKEPLQSLNPRHPLIDRFIEKVPENSLNSLTPEITNPCQTILQRLHEKDQSTLESIDKYTDLKRFIQAIKDGSENNSSFKSVMIQLGQNFGAVNSVRQLHVLDQLELLPELSENITKEQSLKEAFYCCLSIAPTEKKLKNMLEQDYGIELSNNKSIRKEYIVSKHDKFFQLDMNIYDLRSQFRNNQNHAEKIKKSPALEDGFDLTLSKACQTWVSNLEEDSFEVEMKKDLKRGQSRGG